jgi:hypothetical protein
LPHTILKATFPPLRNSTEPEVLGAERPNMSNYALWNVRLRHESLAKTRKTKHLSRRKRARVGLQEAMDRKADGAKGEGDQTS